jgi:hypothetical protein
VKTLYPVQIFSPRFPDILLNRFLTLVYPFSLRLHNYRILSPIKSSILPEMDIFTEVELSVLEKECFSSPRTCFLNVRCLTSTLCATVPKYADITQSVLRLIFHPIPSLDNQVLCLCLPGTEWFSYTPQASHVSPPLSVTEGLFNSISTEVDNWPDDRSLFSYRDMTCFFLISLQTTSGAHPVSYPMAFPRE